MPVDYNVRAREGTGGVGRNRRQPYCADPPVQRRNTLSLCALLAFERVLPAARRAALGEGGGEVVEHLVALLALHVHHVVALHHEVEGLVPALARHALLRHDLEAVAGSAEVERVVAMGAGRILLRRLLRRPLAAALSAG